MDAVERHVTLEADLDEVWELLTRPDDLAGWLGAEVVLDPTPGAAGLVVDHDGTRRRLTVDEVDEGRRAQLALVGRGRRRRRGQPGRDHAHPGGRRHPGRRRRAAAPGPHHRPPSAQASASAGAAWSHRLLHLEALLLLAAAVRG